MPLRKEDFKIANKQNSNQDNNNLNNAKSNNLNNKSQTKNNRFINTLDKITDNQKTPVIIFSTILFLLVGSYLGILLSVNESIILIALSMAMIIFMFSFVFLNESLHLYQKLYNNSQKELINLEIDYQSLIMQHPNTKVKWQQTQDGVPGMDRPWRENDTCIFTAINGKELSITADKKLAETLNQTFNWTY